MNRISEIISTKTNDAFKFFPNKNFYKTIQISQKRFGLLMRNEKEATYSELIRVANYFNVKIEDLIKNS